jgi:hypothetical protein
MDIGLGRGRELRSCIGSAAEDETDIRADVLGYCTTCRQLVLSVFPRLS